MRFRFECVKNEEMNEWFKSYLRLGQEKKNSFQVKYLDYLLNPVWKVLFLTLSKFNSETSTLSVSFVSHSKIKLLFLEQVI